MPDEKNNGHLTPTTIEHLMQQMYSELSQIRIEQTRLRESTSLGATAARAQSVDLMAKFSRRVKVLSERVVERDLTAISSRDIRNPQIVARFMGALGNEERVRILAELDTGNATFNHLERVIQKKGGTLKYHLNQLQEADFVAQEQNRGSYAITLEGKLAYRLAVWLASCLTPIESPPPSVT